MKTWQDQFLISISHSSSIDQVFAQITHAAGLLGFEYCAYMMRTAYPVSDPKTFFWSNYPAAWQARYLEQKYVCIDPTVIHCRRSRQPILWSNETFASTPQLWSEAQAFSLHIGWAQSSLYAHGGSGMLTLVRSHNPITVEELASNEHRMRWLVQAANWAMAPLAVPETANQSEQKLTSRELDVLRWTADGKSSAEIADILSVAIDTVNFHIKNAVRKLCTTNKTAAVVKAALLGLLI